MKQSTFQSQAVPFLLWLSVRGIATGDDIAERWSTDETVPPLVDYLVNARLLAKDGAHIVMDDAAEEFLSEACRSALSDSERRDFTAFVTTFDPIDTDLKVAASLWQRSRGGTHGATDDEETLAAVRDWLAVHERLKQAVRHSRPVVGERLPGYIDQLDQAVARFKSGDRRAFTGANDDSYHSVWFVMHEFILRSVGRSR